MRRCRSGFAQGSDVSKPERRDKVRKDLDLNNSSHSMRSEFHSGQIRMPEPARTNSRRHHSIGLGEADSWRPSASMRWPQRLRQVSWIGR